MDRSEYADADYSQPHVPSDTPPVIDSAADAHAAAGTEDGPGSLPSGFDRSAEDTQIFAAGGDIDEPGKQPDEIVPGQGDNDVPGRTPDEIAPDQGDFDRPDSSPQEMPAQPDTAPMEAPPAD